MQPGGESGPAGGGVRSSWRGGGQVQLAEGRVRSSWGGDQPRQDNRMRSSHYTADGMPLAFTQEDFLVNIT